LPHGFAHETLPRVTTSIWFWIAFHVGVFVAIGIDLLTFRRRGRELSMTAAARRSVLWVIVSCSSSRISGFHPAHSTAYWSGELLALSSCAAP